MISMENIVCRYPGSSREVVSGISFSVGRGEFVSLIGPNGAGKTTVFRILGGYLKPYSGDVRIKGMNILEMNRRIRSKVLGVIPQNIFTPLPYTVRQIVEMGRVSRLSRFGVQSGQDRRAVSDAMVEMEVDRYSGTLFGNLSGGEKQRVMLAMALAQEPEILLLDEPTAHLDIGHISRLMEILCRLNGKRKLTIILITHDINLAARYSSRIILMKEGRIFEDGSAESVLEPELIEAAYGCKSRIHDDGSKKYVLL